MSLSTLHRRYKCHFVHYIGEIVSHLKYILASLICLLAIAGGIQTFSIYD